MNSSISIHNKLKRGFHTSTLLLARKKKLTRTAERRKEQVKIKQNASKVMIKLNPQKYIQKPILKIEDIPGAFPKEPFSEFTIRQLTYRHPTGHFETTGTEKEPVSPEFDFKSSKTVFKASLMAGLDPRKDLNLNPKKLLQQAKEMQKSSSLKSENAININNLSNPLVSMPKLIARAKPKKAKQFERSIKIQAKLQEMPEIIRAYKEELVKQKLASKSELPF